jgi:ribosomal protein S6--L-glutamate ligase
MAKSDVTVIVLTSSRSDLSDTVKKIGESCKKYGVKFYPILTQYAYIDDRTASHESITVHNYDGRGKSITLDPRDVVCFSRGGVANTQIGLAILTIFENTGMFVINERRAMELCANKLYTAIQLDTYKIPTPRTAFVANISSLDDALDKIGNSFPVIVKTLTGAEGVGVSIVESYESLKSVLQTLWKYEAEIIIQEYLPINNDVRVLVLDGKAVAAAMRGKAPKDFRTNLAQGAVGGPYELSDEERQIAEQAAEAFGCYYVGVDMVMSQGKPYIIELNASPGSGNVYRSYFEGSEGADITGQKLIDRVVKHSIDRRNWHFNHREAGLIEPLKIENIGDFKAKLDTGNESYNVLGAEDIVEHNGTVEFRVMGKTYNLPIVSHVRIRTNNIHVDRRPVVELDVTFRNRKFQAVRFSLVPRKLNKYQVLIGNKFMKLAKISVNVNARNMLPENINNHYISKINSLHSLAEIGEMHEMLVEKLTACRHENEKNLIEQAIEHVSVAKYHLKNAQQEFYNKDATMHIDKKFIEFLEFVEENATDEILQVISEAKKRKSRSILQKKDLPSLRDVKSGKISLEDYRKVWSKWQRANERKSSGARRKAGIKRSRAKGQKGIHFKQGITRQTKRPDYIRTNRRAAQRDLASATAKGDAAGVETAKKKMASAGEYSTELAATRFINYPHIKARFRNKKYGYKKPDDVRYGVANIIARGEGPSPGMMKGLRLGWERNQRIKGKKLPSKRKK